MCSVAYRVAAVDDAETIARVKIACWRESYPGLVPASVLNGLDVARAASDWTGYLSAPDNRGWIVKRGGEAIGIGHSVGRHITTLYVLRAVQRQGIGSALLARLLEDVSGRGHTEAELWVLEMNHAARRFYEQRGGQLAGRQPISFASEHIFEVRYIFPLGSGPVD